MHRIRISAVIALLVAAAAFAQTKQPLTHETLFLMKRVGDDANQIYILDLNGSEAQRVTSLSTGARSPLFRPDGKAILFSSSVYPGTSDDEANKKIAKERRDRKYNVRAFDSFPIKAWDRWLDDKQVHLFIQDLDSASKARDILG